MEKVEKLRKVCESFYETHSKFTDWVGPLSEISRILGLQGCDIHLIRNDLPLAHAMGGDTGGLTEGVSEYAKTYLHKEPRSTFLATARQGTIVTDLQLTSQEFMKSSDYYQEFLPRYEMGHCIATVPLRQGADLVYFGAHLKPRAGPPDEALMAQIKMLETDLSRAMRVQLNLIDAKLDSALYSKAFDTLHAGLIIISNNGAVSVTNEKARKILDAGDTVRYSGYKLHAITASEDAKLNEAITQAIASANRQSSAMLMKRPDGRRISLTITPTATKFRDETGAGAFITIRDIDENYPNHAAKHLQMLFKLTPREAEISEKITRGLGIREIAASSGITYETARSMVKQIYAKTGTKRQSDLVALFYRSL